jgi:hypothetical protein
VGCFGIGEEAHFRDYFLYRGRMAGGGGVFKIEALQ